MFAHIHAHLADMEAKPNLTREEAIEGLRPLGLGDFTEVMWNMPLPEYPKISAALPAMSSVSVQQAWTGYSGFDLMRQSANFAGTLATNFVALTGRPLQNSRILDYGCGYGRLLRIMSYFSDDVWGIDPWDKSINECHSVGLKDRIFQSDYLPMKMPVPENFDFIFSFSVFTHLSLRATETNLSAIRRHIKPDGIACITIRPVEYWAMAHSHREKEFTDSKIHEHETSGFAYWPHDRPPVDGDLTYGDTSMTTEWLADLCKRLGWRISATDRSADDPVQRLVFLTPA